MKEKLTTYAKIQFLAKKMMQEIQSCITVAKSETTLVNDCLRIIKSYDIKEYWYYNRPAMVAIGRNTISSQSGKNYYPSPLTLQYNDFVTIDLSLGVDNCWSIFAKSFAIEEGKVKTENFSNAELFFLKKCTDTLHQYLVEIVHPNITFHELYMLMQEKLKQLNVEHLDFKHNFGHSIETHLDERIYIAENVYEKLGNKFLFSFEPHLRLKKGIYGFKHADIYFFQNNTIQKLGEMPTP